MSLRADHIQQDAPSSRASEYEQPLTERLRTFLRLEFLYRQTVYHCDNPSVYASRAAIQSVLDVTAILTRGDVRSETLKELERQIDGLVRYRSQPGVDSRRLQKILERLEQLRDRLRATGPHYLQTIKDSEFLSAIKHRSAIPGGTCEFDLPDYSHWLRQPFESRRGTLEHWMLGLVPLLDTVSELLWLTRESNPPEERLAAQGMFQYNVSREVPCRLLRVCVNPVENCFPEISGSQHRFTIRFMEWSEDNTKASQVARDIPFQLALC